MKATYHNVSFVAECAVLFALTNEQHLIQEEHVTWSFGSVHPERSFGHQFTVGRQILALDNPPNVKSTTISVTERHLSATQCKLLGAFLSADWCSSAPSCTVFTTRCQETTH